jgi:hypothetical protein
MDNLRFHEGYPKIRESASGHLSLELSETVSYDRFPEYAELFLSTVGGIVKKRSDSFIMCIWHVVINGQDYRLVYDDYPCGVSLEPNYEASDKEILRIKRVLESV